MVLNGKIIYEYFKNKNSDVDNDVFDFPDIDELNSDILNDTISEDEIWESSWLR